jgi:hypothetical protein
MRFPQPHDRTDARACRPFIPAALTGQHDGSITADLVVELRFLRAAGHRGCPVVTALSRPDGGPDGPCAVPEVVDVMLADCGHARRPLNRL